MAEVGEVVCISHEMPSSARARLTIGVIDHDIAWASSCAAELRAAGFETVLFENGLAALAALGSGSLPRLVLLELDLADKDPFRLIRAIRHAGHTVVVVTSQSAPEHALHAIRAGALGYVHKPDARGRLAKIVEETQRGGAPLSPWVARLVVSALREADAPTLTRRERQVLHAIAQGLTYPQIATALGVSVDTVRSHVRNLYAKLEVSTKAEAVVRGIRAGLLG